MRIADFIRTNSAQIISEWENFAQTLVPVSDSMTPLALRNHIKEILIFITVDIESPQTGPEQTQKSRGEGPATSELAQEGGTHDASGPHSAAETHAALRLAGGFNMDQMVSEYRALRASIVKLWSAETAEMTQRDLLDLTRFNEAIDQALTESITYYSKKLAGSKDLFLAILSHDLRNPLGAILGSAQLTLKMEPLGERQTMLLSQIVDSTLRVNEIVTHLLDLTRARFGSGLPVVRAPMNFGFVARQMFSEMEAAHPNREINLEISGDMEGEWDKARIGQVFSNLIGNAIQYSFKDTPVKITVTGGSENIILSVHNQGIPIPSDKVGRIFDSLTRSAGENGQQSGSTNLGLGLYITKEIMSAHGGKIEVTSSEKGGTTFTARFPRKECRPGITNNPESYGDQPVPVEPNPPLPRAVSSRLDAA